MISDDPGDIISHQLLVQLSLPHKHKYSSSLIIALMSSSQSEKSKFVFLFLEVKFVGMIVVLHSILEVECFNVLDSTHVVKCES